MSFRHEVKTSYPISPLKTAIIYIGWKSETRPERHVNRECKPTTRDELFNHEIYVQASGF